MYFLISFQDLTKPPVVIEDQDLFVCSETERAMRWINKADARLLDVYMLKHYFRKVTDVSKK
jgi:hypothetical protein